MYQELLEIRKEKIENESDWTWIKEDIGAWNGPRNDWINSHNEKYFSFLKDKRVVVTAGGNQGMYTRLYSNHFQTVYSFEPDPLNFHCLVMNNQRDNVIKIQGALGADNGFVTVKRYNMKNTGMHKIEESGTIPLFALDSFRFEILDLLQLDIEGYERFAILGALDTLERCKPVLAIENGNRPNILEILEPIGYRCVEQSISDAIFVYE